MIRKQKKLKKLKEKRNQNKWAKLVKKIQIKVQNKIKIKLETVLLKDGNKRMINFLIN
jgi:hypothetical protein